MKRNALSLTFFLTLLLLGTSSLRAQADDLPPEQSTPNEAKESPENGSQEHLEAVPLSESAVYFTELFARFDAQHEILFESMEAAYAMRSSLRKPVADLSTLELADAMSTMDAYEEYKRQLITVYDSVSNEAENAASENSIYALALKLSESSKEASTLLNNQAENALHKRFTRTLERFSWTRRESRAAPGRFISSEGWGQDVEADEVTRAFILPQELVADLSKDQLRSSGDTKALIDLSVDFLYQMQLRIDPVEREIARLKEYTEEVELARFSDLDNNVVSDPEAATNGEGMPQHERTQKRIENYQRMREQSLEELQDSFLRFARRGKRLGLSYDYQGLLSAEIKVSPELQLEIDPRIKEALEDLGTEEIEPLLAIETRLKTSVEEWVEAARGATGMKKNFLEAKIRARKQRLLSLHATIREARVGFLVRRKTVQRQLSSLVTTEARLLDLEERWDDQALKFYGVAILWVLAILVSALVVIRIVKFVARRIIHRFNAEHDNVDKDTEARAKTISTAFSGTISAVIWVVAALMVLGRFGIDYRPLLVATGGIGLAVGFGAQSLVKDFFSGFFILLENQFVVGDVITIAGKTGTVDEINLRTTRMRSLDGTYHTVPNGQITAVSNMTHKWSRMVVVINAGYREDPDVVRNTINSVGTEMFADAAWSERLLEPPIVLGLDSLNASSIDFKVLARTKSGEQWAAEREFRRRIKIRFDLEDIEIPFQYVNYIQSQPEESKVLRMATESTRKLMTEDNPEVPDEGAGKRAAVKAQEAAEPQAQKSEDDDAKSGAS